MEVLLKNKQAIINQEVEKLKALKNVQAKADQIVKEGKIYSVMNKKQLPPSGDKHDYMSTGPYWWPDPSKPYLKVIVALAALGANESVPPVRLKDVAFNSLT